MQDWSAALPLDLLAFAGIATLGWQCMVKHLLILMDFLWSDTWMGASDPGARNATLFLAQNHPTVTRSMSMKDGVWAPQCLVYIYYPPELWSKKATEFKQAMSKPTTNIVSSLVRISARRLACPCPNCVVPVCDYKNCMLKKLIGVWQLFTSFPSTEVSRTRLKINWVSSSLKEGNIIVQFK